MLPPSMLGIIKRMLASMRISFRALEGVLTELLLVKAPDHTTIWKPSARRRRRSLSFRLARLSSLSIAPASRRRCEGSGCAVDWHKHRGFVKAQVAVDVGTLEVLGVITTDERTMDKDRFSCHCWTRCCHAASASSACWRTVRTTRTGSSTT